MTAGYLGRFLALHIHENNLASEVRLVDKVLPQLAWLAPEFEQACAQNKFLQADASREREHPPSGTFAPPRNHLNCPSNIVLILCPLESFSRVFDRLNGQQYDYVFNCGGETRFSQPDEVYRLRSYSLSVALGNEAARRRIPAFVEVSTGMVYKPDRTPRRETDKLKPWIKLAQWKLSAEEDLGKIPGLNLVVLRMAHVYGDYDKGFVAKALCLARVYRDLRKEMNWLWTKELRINTVHVKDVARALWTAAEWRANSASVPKELGSTSGRRSSDTSTSTAPTFNVVDHGSTSQGTLAKIIHEVFSIETGFQGQFISQFARMNLDHVIEELNEEILQPWADMLQKKGITRPGPLSPFLEKELLKDTDLSLDGSLFEKVTGFKYTREELTVAEVKDMVTSYERMNWWP